MLISDDLCCHGVLHAKNDAKNDVIGRVDYYRTRADGELSYLNDMWTLHITNTGFSWNKVRYSSINSAVCSRVEGWRSAEAASPVAMLRLSVLRRVGILCITCGRVQHTLERAQVPGSQTRQSILVQYTRCSYL